MGSFEIGLLGFLFFIYIYMLVDRVCRCAEQISLMKNVDLPETNAENKTAKENLAKQ